MATFSAPTFSSARYASFRPTYPREFFSRFLLPYHQGPRHTLLDLGCGPGTVARPLSAEFGQTIGCDPSATMLQTARSLTPRSEYPSITYHQAPAESLGFLAQGSVDVAVAGQAAHWFDQAAWWAEMARVVRAGGTVAVWGYKDCIFPEHPSASVAFKRFAHGADRLGPHWSQPGRGIVEARYRALRPPELDWADTLRWEYEPEFRAEATAAQEREARVPVEGDDGQPGFGSLVKTRDGLMGRTMRWADFGEYIRTWSAVHSWGLRNPGLATRRSAGSKGDIVDGLLEDIQKAEGFADGWEENDVLVEWGHGVVITRRK